VSAINIGQYLSLDFCFPPSVSDKYRAIFIAGLLFLSPSVSDKYRPIFIARLLFPTLSDHYPLKFPSHSHLSYFLIVNITSNHFQILIYFISFTALCPRIRFPSRHQLRLSRRHRIHPSQIYSWSLSRCPRFPARYPIATPRRRERYLRRHSRRSPRLNHTVWSNLTNKRSYRKLKHLDTGGRFPQKILSLFPTIPTARSCHHQYPPCSRSQVSTSRYKSHSHITTCNWSFPLCKGQQISYSIRSSSHHVRRSPLQGRFIQSHPTITHSNGMQPNQLCKPFRRREKGFRR